MFLIFVPNFLPKITATSLAIVRMACAVVERTSSIAKFGFAKAFVRFAIVLGNEAKIKVNRFGARFLLILTILTFGSAILHIWSARSGFGNAGFRSWSWILKSWRSRSGFRVGSLDFRSVGFNNWSLRSRIGS